MFVMRRAYLAFYSRRRIVARRVHSSGLGCLLRFHSTALDPGVHVYGAGTAAHHHYYCYYYLIGLGPALRDDRYGSRGALEDQ